MTTGDQHSPAPQWNESLGRWTADGHAWDDVTQRWVPLSAAAAPLAPGPTEPGTDARARRTDPPAQGSEHVGPPGPSRPRRLRTGTIVGLSLGGVGVLAVVALVIGLAVLPRGTTPPGLADSSSTSAADVVRTYLEAVAEADAETALAQLSSLPSDTVLLTDDVLEKSRQLAPVADIEIGEPVLSGYTGHVPVTFSIGDSRQQTTFPVDAWGDDETWGVGSLATLSLPGSVDSLPLAINGQAVSGDSVHAFPGTYEITTDSPLFALAGPTTVTLRDADWQTLSGVEAVLSPDGLQRFRTAVTDAAHACVASTALQAGCGVDIRAVLDDGTKVIDGTVTRTLGGEAATRLANLEPISTYGAPLQMSTGIIGRVDLTADCEKDGVRMSGCRFTLNPSLGSAIVDFAVDPPVVRWD